jgi:hypothetical protein
MTIRTRPSKMNRLVTRHQVSFATTTRGRKRLQESPSGAAVTSPPLPNGKVPRVSRLMALAIRFEELVREGIVQDYAELARLGHVTRARISQVTALRFLAPDIQEALLFLPRTLKGRDPIRERMVRPIAGEPDWGRQRALWGLVLKQTGVPAK